MKDPNHRGTIQQHRISAMESVTKNNSVIFGQRLFRQRSGINSNSSIMERNVESKDVSSVLPYSQYFLVINYY